MFEKIKRMKSHHQIGFAFLIAFAVVAVWRGLWGFLDVYLLPSNYELSLWISFFIGMVILIITHQTTKELM